MKYLRLVGEKEIILTSEDEKQELHAYVDLNGDFNIRMRIPCGTDDYGEFIFDAISDIDYEKIKMLARNGKIE